MQNLQLLPCSIAVFLVASCWADKWSEQYKGCEYRANSYIYNPNRRYDWDNYKNIVCGSQSDSEISSGYTVPRLKPSVMFLNKEESSKPKTVKDALAAGFNVYGMKRYWREFEDRLYFHLDPEVCCNEYERVTYYNGTVYNTEWLNYLVCPYKTTDEKSDEFCCGPEYQEYCCGYYQSPKKHGIVKLVVGIIGGVLGLSIIVVIVTKCLIYHYKY